MDKDLAERLLDAVKGYVQRAADALVTRIEAVERRVAEIPAGPKGEKGDPGESIKGDVGLPGADGRSVDAAEVAAMVAGEVAKAVSAIPPASNGRDGIDGKDGSPGADGRDGRDGKDGREGVDGVDGSPGRDAIDLDILPAITESKSYPRGTFARHAGGLWRATHDTDGMRGWECIVEGVAGVKLQPDDADSRLVTLGVTTSTGKSTELALRLPATRYRGVFREGDDYDLGDMVTWSGSVWHCNRATSDKPIEGGDAWTLAVKRGRDGKDGAAPPAPRGPVRTP